MGRNHANRIVSEIDPIYANKDWEPESFQPPTYRVAAYARVSSDKRDHGCSLESRQHFYETAIGAQPTWKFVGLYADDGILGASARNHKEFDRMVADCKADKIDLIVVKGFSSFSNRVTDCLDKVQLLLSINPPVGIYFEESQVCSFITGKENFLIEVAKAWGLKVG